MMVIEVAERLKLSPREVREMEVNDVLLFLAKWHRMGDQKTNEHLFIMLKGIFDLLVNVFTAKNGR